MVRSCTCLGLGRPSLAGVLGAVRGTAIPDYGDAVPGTGTVGLPESTTGTDRRPPRAHGPAACPPAVGCCHGVQGRFSLAARVHACAGADRSEEHTSELQSLMRNSYAVFLLKKKKQ